MEAEREQRRVHPRATAGRDRSREIDLALERSAQRLEVEHRSFLGDELSEGKVLAVWDAAAFDPRPRLRFGGGEATAAARVEDLLRLCRDVRSHLLERAHQLGTEARGEALRERRGHAVFDRSSFALPFGKTAVEHRDPLVAEDAERPPDSRRAEDPR